MRHRPPGSGRGDSGDSRGFRLSFPAAFAAWQAREARQGPVHVYGAALKLPDLARGAGESARIQAAWAIGSTLFWRGRFADALRWLPASRERGWTLALQGQRDAALALPQDATLLFFLDEPEACMQRLSLTDSPIEAARMELLRYWAKTRLAEPADEGCAQRALATLRRMAPSEEARGLAVYAEAAFRRHPVHALAHLDHALDRFARFGLHHLEERLLEHKACALEAAGMLAEADRFRHAAAEVAKRQR